MTDTLTRTDASLRAAFVRERRTLAATAVGLALIWVPLLLVSDLDLETVLRAAGVLLLAATAAVLAIDGWRPRLRGSTSVDPEAGETHLQAARWHAWCVLVAAVALVVLAASPFAGEGLADTASDGRRGAVLYLFVAMVPVVLGFAVLAVVRPLRVTLDMSGITVRQPWWSRSVAWDDLVAVAPSRVASTARPVHVSPRQGRPVPVVTRHLTVTPAALAALVQHYRDTVADRSELGTVASQDRIDAERDAAVDLL